MSPGFGMKNENRLTKPEQYQTVYQEGLSRADRLVVLKARVNQRIQYFSKIGLRSVKTGRNYRKVE